MLGKLIQTAVYRCAWSCHKNLLAPTVAAKLRDVSDVPVAAIWLNPIIGEVKDGIIICPPPHPTSPRVKPARNPTAEPDTKRGAPTNGGIVM